MNIIFAGTGKFGIPALEALITSKHHIMAVYTPPDRPAGRGLKLTPSPIKLAAIQHQIPVYQPDSLRDPLTQQTLKELNADLMVIVVYGLLLPKIVLEMPRYGCINIHPSLLPRWRGAAPIVRPIEAGDPTTGVTIMQLDEGWDTGDLWLQESCDIDDDETSESLHDKLAVMGASLLLKTIDLLETGRPTPQNSIHATYAAKIEKSEAELDWQKPAIVLERKVRAFNPWPVAHTTWNGELLRIWEAKALTDVKVNLRPGMVSEVHSNGIDVATGEGVLRLSRVQMAGGKSLNAGDFIHGKKIFSRQTCFGESAGELPTN